jgi:hypothetical protein
MGTGDLRVAHVELATGATPIAHGETMASYSDDHRVHRRQHQSGVAAIDTLPDFLVRVTAAAALELAPFDQILVVAFDGAAVVTREAEVPIERVVPRQGGRLVGRDTRERLELAARILGDPQVGERVACL